MIASDSGVDSHPSHFTLCIKPLQVKGLMKPREWHHLWKTGTLICGFQNLTPLRLYTWKSGSETRGCTDSSHFWLYKDKMACNNKPGTPYFHNILHSWVWGNMWIGWSNSHDPSKSCKGEDLFQCSMARRKSTLWQSAGTSIPAAWNQLAQGDWAVQYPDNC